MSTAIQSLRERPRRLAMLASLLGLAVAVVVIYVRAAAALRTGQDARRNDDCACAEAILDNCWRLPGLNRSLELEELLLGVQQGDLGSEPALQARVGGPSSESLLILEALAKGNLAIFRWNEARQYADALLERSPDHAQGLWLRGQAWIKLQQEVRAASDLDRALVLDPGSVGIRLLLAEFLYDQGELHGAIGHYTYLQNQRPNDPRIVMGIARCRHDAGELADAKQTLELLLNQRPDEVPALVERGRLALRLGQAEDGERWLRRAESFAPHDPDAQFALKLCLEAQSKRDDALQQRIDVDERLRTTLRRRLRDSRRDPGLLCEVGQLTMRTGPLAEAAGWLFLSLHEDPHHRPAHAALAEYFDQTGQHRRAEHHRRLAGVLGENRVSKSQPAAAFAVTPARAVKVSRTQIPAAREASFQQVHQLCGACHVYPPPDSMPRIAWRKEVKQGYSFLRDSKLPGEFPSLESVVRYYEARAPEYLPTTGPSASASRAPVRFDKRGGGWLDNLPPIPGVADVELVTLSNQQNLDLLVCDTRLDHVLAFKPYAKSPKLQPLGPVLVPGRAAVVDLDGDGRRDVVAASLGQFFPTDDKVGSVVWLRAQADGNFEPVTLLESVGRVADVQSADFNGDGKMDLVVAVFGWRKTGEVLYLENRTTDWSRPEFVARELDGRHGAIQVPVTDLNGDGLPDFVALISQEHETVVAFLNQGGGQFQQQTLFTGPHPGYGCNSLQVVDLDADGDPDVLLTNGDVLDRPYVLKLYHGIQWLENQGQFPFVHRPLLPMYGVSRAVATDLDHDGDQDIVAVSFLPGLEFPQRDHLQIPSVVLLEQTQRREFSPHTLETGACDHFSCAAGDWDGDGHADLVTGNFSWKRSQAFADAIVLWKNIGR